MFSLFWPVRLAFGIFKLGLNLVVLASCLLTVAAMMGDKGWLWSLTTHFRVQYMVIQLFALGLILLACQCSKKDNLSLPAWTESRLNILFLSVFAGLNLLQIAPYYLPGARPSVQELRVTHGIKLMHINLFGRSNHHRESVIDLIKTEKPDLLDLVEYTEAWPDQLIQSGVLKPYPYRVVGRNHIALYSKLPLHNGRLVYADPARKVANQANIITQITLNKEPITILVAHPASPIRPSHLNWLQHSFHQWELERKGLGKNLVLVGDLNTSPWSAEFHTLLRQTGLRDSQLGYGLQPSWPMLLPILGIRSTPTLLTQLFAIPFRSIMCLSAIVF
jgi:endonuclease/exonuclease/phosphatase (EEP) superfamily protein YafD